MPEIAALEKHACPACGAQAEWNPAKLRLVCPFCGTEAPYTFDADTSQIREIDLVATLRELPEELRGWRTATRSVQCQSCKAVMVFDPARVGQNCEFCGSPALVDYQQIKDPIRPQGVLPFKVSQPQVRESIRAWLGSLWFAPGKLKKSALVDTVHSVYVPYWTFDSQVHCPWEAEAGHYYYVTEEYRDNQGRPRTRQVQHVRWEHVSGVVDHFFDDEPVPGTQGIPVDLLREVEPFPTRDVSPYDTGYLSGHVVEHYQVVLVDAYKRAQDQMRQQLEAMAGQQIQADTYRGMRVYPEFERSTFKHVLVPVWLLTYTYGPKSYQVVANGYTGRAAGRYPKSPWKIFFLVLFILCALLVLGVVVTSQQ
jgi:hypothetical protein